MTGDYRAIMMFFSNKKNLVKTKGPEIKEALVELLLLIYREECFKN